MRRRGPLDARLPGGCRVPQPTLPGHSCLLCITHCLRPLPSLPSPPVQAFFEREEAAASGEAVQQPYCLVDAGLLQAAHLHYARQFPHLPWSRRLLAEHRQQQEQQQQPAKKKQKLGGGEAAAAEEDGAAAAEAGAVGGRVQRLLREAEVRCCGRPSNVCCRVFGPALHT